ncbi:hypothetical protein N7451_008050 [Penicillium sp. IBT 35674x]|nr:hypothetical protein N7451_008050 [Penicillium sp. IBT 35674x]
MADGRQQRAASQPASTNYDATALSREFEQLMRTKRFNQLQETRSMSRSPAPVASPSIPPPSRAPPPPPFGASPHPSQPPPTPKSNALKGLPIMPSPPHDAASLKFFNLLKGLSVTPTKYENPGLLDEALCIIPLDRLYSEAEEESQIMHAQAASTKGKPEWGYQDCVIRALLRWFKSSFFQFVNNPPVFAVLHAHDRSGHDSPSPDETARGATRVELYRCSGSDLRMLCRAVGARVRWVWNSEDHVWTEVYSEHQRRWVHVDACEGAWDQPRLYTEGWNRKISYCIAFSIDGATDVTRRYVRNFAKNGSPRNRTSEEVVLWSIHEIRRKRRENMSKADQARLIKEDEREEREFRGYTASALAAEINNLLPRSMTARAHEQKHADALQEASTEWLAAHGHGHSGPDRSPGGR